MAQAILGDAPSQGAGDARARDADPGSGSARWLGRLLWTVAGLSVLYFFVLWAAVAGHPRGDPAVFLTVNAPLLLIKVAIIRAVVRQLGRRRAAAAIVALLMATGGVVYSVVAFDPDPAVRALGLQGLHRGVSVINVAFGAAGLVLSVGALRHFRRSHAPAPVGVPAATPDTPDRGEPSARRSAVTHAEQKGSSR